MDIQKALITKFRKNIYRLVINAIEVYKLIEENDKIMVCISGGKDSFLLAKILQELKNHGPIKFDLIYCSMNPGYNEENKEQIKKNAEILGIDVEMFDAPIFKYTKTQKENPCYICARMRRGYLYSYALKKGCNKIALGHHLNDVIETTLLGIMYSNEITFMRPKLKSKNFDGITLIRPLYKVKEKHIIEWMNYHNLKFLQCACPLQENYNLEQSSKRKEVKQIINDLKKYNPEIEDCIFRSIHNLNLDTIVEARNATKKITFNDIFDEVEDE